MSERKMEAIKQDLDRIKKELSLQLNALDDDMNSLHKRIIQLGVKYPEQQELIEFIVFINDRLGTRHSQLEEIMSETISDLIGIKKKTLDINISLANNVKHLKSKKSFWEMLFTKITSIHDVKVLFGLAFVLSAVLAKVFYPEASSEFISEMIKTTIGK